MGSIGNMGMMAVAGTSTTVDAGFLLQFILVVSLLGNAVGAWIMIVRRDKSQKREVSFADQFTTVKECHLVHGMVNERLECLEQKASEQREKLSEEINKVYLRVEQLGKETNQRFDDVPGRIIAILNNTKAI